MDELARDYAKNEIDDMWNGSIDASAKDVYNATERRRLLLPAIFEEFGR